MNSGLNKKDLAARGERADTCYNEFIGPALRDQRKVYAERIADIAVQELDPKKRLEKITSLATAIKILDNIDSAIRVLIEEGKMSQIAELRIADIDRMTASQRRLREFVPH